MDSNVCLPMDSSGFLWVPRDPYGFQKVIDRGLLLEAVHTTDSASRKLFDRASELEKNPPGPDWVPVNELREK